MPATLRHSFAFAFAHAFAFYTDIQSANAIRLCIWSAFAVKSLQSGLFGFLILQCMHSSLHDQASASFHQNAWLVHACQNQCQNHCQGSLPASRTALLEQVHACHSPWALCWPCTGYRSFQSSHAEAGSELSWQGIDLCSNSGENLCPPSVDSGHLKKVVRVDNLHAAAGYKCR